MTDTTQSKTLWLLDYETRTPVRFDLKSDQTFVSPDLGIERGLLLTVEGDELSPTVERGWRLFLDARVCTYTGNGIYAIKRPGGQPPEIAQLVHNPDSSYTYTAATGKSVRLDDIAGMYMAGRCVRMSVLTACSSRLAQQAAASCKTDPVPPSFFMAEGDHGDEPHVDVDVRFFLDLRQSLLAKDESNETPASAGCQA